MLVFQIGTKKSNIFSAVKEFIILIKMLKSLVFNSYKKDTFET